jgi:dipeptidyl aminopeptidase/acylaminoacyl peptidase
MRNPARSILLFSLVTTPLFAQTKPADTLLTVARYLDYETVSNPEPSPDGSQVIFVRRSVDQMKDSFESALWIMQADGSRLRFLVKGSSAVWSPDGTRIAYLAEGEGEPKGPQIFVRYMDAEGAVTQVTKVLHAPGNVRWSPDGKWLGFSMLVPQEASWKIDLPKAPEGAQWTKAPRVVDRMVYRADRSGYLAMGFTHLFLVPATGGTPRQVTTGEWNVGARAGGLPGAVGWDWLPDGKSLVVDGDDAPDAELHYQRSNLYLVDLATGGKRRLTTQDGDWSGPIVAPDGKLIAFTGFPAAGPVSYRADDIYTIAPDGSGLTLRSAGLDRDPAGLRWSSDSKSLYFTVSDRGTSNLWVAQLGAQPRQLTTGTHLLSNPGLTRSSVFAVRSNYSRPPDIVRIDLKRPAQLEQLTEVNEDLLMGTRLGEVEEIWYPSSGGVRIQGWIVKPPSFDPAKQYPLILEIHGGPHGNYGVGFNYTGQNFAANGFVVLYTNPRGSTSYGSAFGNSIFHAYPSVDYDDLMAGVDTVLGRGYVDPKRMYVGGCSGGGVLSSWVIGHTDRFAAAAVRCPVIDWLSFAGETDIPLFT